MRSLLALLPVAAASVTPRQDYFSFGNAFSTGPTDDGTFIIDSTTTLILPDLQSPHEGNLGLWPGMGMDNGDLVQGLAISTVGVGSPCNFGEEDVNWCITASTYNGYQTDGDVFAAVPGDEVTYHYVYNEDTGNTDQTVSVNGDVVSTLSTSSGRGGLGWGTAMECQQVMCGTVPEHHYVDTTIILSQPNPDYINTLVLTGASGDLVTSDGGTTWTVDDITINEYTYT